MGFPFLVCVILASSIHVTTLLIEMGGRASLLVLVIGIMNLLQTDPRNHNPRRHRNPLRKSWRLLEGER